MTDEERRAFKELVAALGGYNNIIQYGFIKTKERTRITINLRMPSLVNEKPFTYFENVYFLMQSVGVTIEYIKSDKADLLLKFLLETIPRKHTSYNNKRTPISLKFDPKKAIYRQKLIDDKKEEKVKEMIASNLEDDNDEESDEDID